VLEQVARPEDKQNASLRLWLIPDQPLPVKQALLFALQIARGMAHAQSVLLDFVHRDLKPENVLVGADTLPGWSVNRLRVTDLGLASVLQEVNSREMTTDPEADNGSANLLHQAHATRNVVGTPVYMAPEQWTGGELTPATDIYALGLILYERVSPISLRKYPLRKRGEAPFPKVMRRAPVTTSPNFG
jgi:eukaryotic-like serine/threonine-protein kinase